MTSRLTVVAQAVALAAVLMMLLAAVEPWTLTFESGSSGAMAIRATVGSTWITIVTTRRVLGWNLRDAVIASLSVTVATTVAIMTVAWDITVLPALASSIIHGGPQILSTELPIATSPAVIGPIVLTVWACTCTASMIASGQRNVVAVLAAALAVFGGGIAVVAGTASNLDERLTASAVLLLASFAAFAFMRSIMDLPFMTGRALFARTVTGVLLVVAAWTAGTAGATAIPFGASEPGGVRFEPAAMHQAPPEPLSTMRSLRVDPAHDGTIATLSGPSLVDWHGFLSVAAYPPAAYQDGQRWAARARFVPSGGIRPVGDVGGRPDGGWPMHINLSAERALDAWLPHPSAALAVDGLRVSTNQQGLIPSDPTDCDPACAYSVRTDPLPTLDQILAQGRQIGDGFLPWRPGATGGERSPGRQVCEVLAARLQQRTPPEAFDCDEPVAPSLGFVDDLRSFVRDGRRVEDIDGDAPRLAATNQLQPVLELIGAPREANPAGDPHQFATAYALLAEHFGIDARLVTGFRLCPAPVDGIPALCISSNTTDVGAEHSWAWVEISLPDIGWTIVDPSPHGVIEEGQELAGGAAGRQQDGRRDDPERINVQPGPSDMPRQLASSTPPSSWLAPAVLAALIVFVPVPAAVTRMRRRVRRRSGTPEQRTVGAFHEVIDALFDTGCLNVAGRSAMELTRAAQSLVGERVRDVAHLGASADRAVFSTREVPDEMADEAWTVARKTAKVLRRQAPLRYRVRTMIRPAPSALTTRQRLFASGDNLRRKNSCVEADRDALWSAVGSQDRLDLAADRSRDRRMGFLGARSGSGGEPRH